MARVVWRREALEDIGSIIRYINQFDPVAADSIGTKLLDLGDSLSTFPRRGRPIDEEHREMTTVPPYVVLYQVDGDDVVILSVRHGRRRPA